MSDALGRLLTPAVSIIGWGAPVVVFLSVGGLLAFLFFNGGAALSMEMLFGEASPIDAVLGRVPVFEGIWPACVGTFYLVCLSCLLAIPMGIMSGIYMAEYAPRRLRAPMVFATDLIACIPSILMGLFGFALILFFRSTIFPQAKTGLWLSALCMAILILPYCTNATRVALEGLPEGLRLIGPGLGLSRTQNVFCILLPAALKGIMGGVILSIGRAAEDTAVILLTGVVANAGVPRSLMHKYEALPFHIYYTAAEFRTPLELKQGFGTALVLLCLTSIIFVGAHALRRSMEKRWR
jgi:phosphate transport system permease protein